MAVIELLSMMIMAPVGIADTNNRQIKTASTGNNNVNQ
jgi:hypothetical protein